MKYDTHSLTGARLARAVLECLMLSGTWQLDRPLPQAQGYVFLSPEDQAAWRPFRPDEVWAHGGDRKSTRLNSSHSQQSRMPSSA